MTHNSLKTLCYGSFLAIFLEDSKARRIQLVPGQKNICVLLFHHGTERTENEQKKLAAELGLGLGTVSRYIGMGLPCQKVGGKYDFDLDVVKEWIGDNIDSRQCEYRMSREQAVQGLITLSTNLLKFVDIEKLSESLKK